MPQQNAWTAIVGMLGEENIATLSLRNASFNFLALDGEGDLLDSNPQIMILLVLSKQDVIDWAGEAYNAVFIAGTPDAYKKAGSYERTPRATTQHVDQAFQTFETVASTLVALYSKDTFERMVTLGGKTYGKPDASMQSQCRVLQQSVQLNGLYVPCPGEDLRFPYIAFSENMPGPNVKQPWTPGSGHCAPHPLLLLARSLNSWANMRAGNDTKMRFVQACMPPLEAEFDEVEWDFFETLHRLQMEDRLRRGSPPAQQDRLQHMLRHVDSSQARPIRKSVIVKSPKILRDSMLAACKCAQAAAGKGCK